MKVFYTSAFKGRSMYKNYVNQVFEVIKSFEDIELTSTQDRSYLAREPEAKQVDDLKFLEDRYKYVHYNSVKRAIFEADAVIIDATSRSFRLGHEATLAVQQGKPTLVLSQHKDYSNLIDHPHFFGAKYHRLTLKEIVRKFLKHAQRTTLKHRFNMFTSDDQKEFIEKKSVELGINKSEFVRSLIEEEMRKD